MIAVDTNILVRYAVKDDPQQTPLDTAFIKNNSCFFSKTVLLELVWVLSSKNGYNLIRYVMLQSALLTDILPRQISFKHTLQLWLCWHQNVPQSTELYPEALLMLIATTNRVCNRRGRVEPRAVKRRAKPYPLLRQKRELAREEIRKNGHPKKLK